MTEIAVLSPASAPPPVDPTALAPRSELPERPVVGLIPNGKPLARELLEVLGSEFGTRLGRAVELEWQIKPSASYTITAEQADVLAVRAHVIISGLGD